MSARATIKRMQITVRTPSMISTPMSMSSSSLSCPPASTGPVVEWSVVGEASVVVPAPVPDVARPVVVEFPVVFPVVCPAVVGAILPVVAVGDAVVAGIAVVVGVVVVEAVVFPVVEVVAFPVVEAVLPVVGKEVVADVVDVGGHTYIDVIEKM